jgi:autotransporter translocation and assembly factor TamB
VRLAVGPVDWASLPTQLHLDPMIDARVVLAGRATGTPQRPSFDGEADVRDVVGLALPWGGGIGGRFAVRYGDARFETEGHLADGESIVARFRSGVSLDVVEAIRQGPRLGDWNVEADFEDVPIRRVRFFAEKPVVGKVRGNVSVAVTRGNATLRGQIESQELEIGDERIPELVARVDYSGQLLTISARAKQSAGGEIEARTTWRLPWQGGAGATAEALGWPLSGEMTARAFRISSLLPSIPEVAALDGRLDGQVSLVRFEDSPQLRGRLALTRGIFEVAGFGQRFTDIEARVTLAGTRFTIESLSLRDRAGAVRAVRAGEAPPGEGTLRGLVPNTFRLHLDSSRFPIVREGAPLARVSGRIDVSGRVQGRTITMDADLRGARVDLPARATRDLQSLAEHPDIVVVTREVTPEPEGEPIVFVVHVDLRDEMWLLRDDMRIAFVGEVNVWYAWAGDLLLEGTIELSRGEAEAYGRRFRIDTGYVTFEALPGKLDPVLDVRAIWENPEHLVLLRVSGRLSSPRLSFGSDPPDLSQDQIMMLLVTGRTDLRDPNDQQTVDDAAERQTAALLQGIGVALAQQSVHESLPDVIPIVAIEPGEEGFADARYRAGRQFGRFYSELSYSSTEAPRPGQNRWETRIEYRLSRRWSVESHAGDENQGADILWSYSY